MKLVGIFSREDESSYQWLISHLLECRDVADVRPVGITNNFQRFEEEASKCHLAILYHSKKRGRVNVTDVTDSLYDMELQHLSAVYGKQNVLVVIDDLDSSSEEEKTRILTHQPSIKDLARGLFIFSPADKDALRYQSSSFVLKELEDMKRMIGGDKERGVRDPERSLGFSPQTERRLKPLHLFLLIFIPVLTSIVIVLIVVFSYSTHPALGNTPPALGTTHPAPEITHPAPETTHPAPETTHPAPETTHPAPETTHPAPETTHPAPETTHPAPETTHPAPETTHPAPETTHPAPETTHPAPETTHPALETTHPALETTHPPLETTPPAPGN